MTFDEFNEFQAELIEEVRAMAGTKGKEYAYNHEDRFQNFNEAAYDMAVSRLTVAMIYADKHIRSLKSYIKHQRTYSNETIQSRIVDIITYMTLIAGMIKEDTIT